ncbi:MAG: hypothetical protein ACP5T6_00030 [Candidatus Micrarchaeia archaeon]
MCYGVFKCVQENTFAEGTDVIGPTGKNYSNTATMPQILREKEEENEILIYNKLKDYNVEVEI